MRLAEDTHSWNARGVIRRDYRHDLSTPEVVRHRGIRRNKRSQPKQKVVRPSCKHVWVEVDYQEYLQYFYRGGYRIYGLSSYGWEPSCSTYQVCAGCLSTRSRIDKGRARYLQWKRRRQRDRERAGS